MSSNETIMSHQPESISFILKSQRRWWISGAVFCFFLASILMSGWPAGAIPNLSFPYVYDGDGLSHAWLAQRAIEGWIFDNPRSGYPFGSNFLDYPGSDSGNILILKILGLITGSYYSAFNLFFLLSFPAIFIAAFSIFRYLGISSAFALTAAISYAFLPFHFQRLGHSFYLWYFVAPIFFYLCFFCFKSTRPSEKSILKNIFSLLFLCIAIASFGVYYALFGVILFASSAIAIFLQTGRAALVKTPIILIFMVIIGVFINVAPNIGNKLSQGPNPEVAVRSPIEAEIYGFKLVQLLLPRPDHRDEHIAKMVQQYNSSYPLVNENMTSGLGIFGSIGFIALFFAMVKKLATGKIDYRLSILAILTLILFLFGTIGGLGSLFSTFISSSIRGWNRISIFIAFGTIAAFFIALQSFINHHFDGKKRKIIIFFLAFALTAIGLYDQTTPACISCNERTKNNFEIDKIFVQSLESSLPKNSAIYQLPYMPFPETTPLHRLHTYDQVAGFLHSKSLRWSYAGMKGREGDLFYRALSQEPIEKQIQIIQNMGFSGIYIDRRGYQDNANQLVETLTSLLGKASLQERSDGAVAFFKIPRAKAIDLYGLTAPEIMKKSDFTPNRLGPRHHATLSEGIDFTRSTWPDFIYDIKGISGPEPWGRWSDASLNSEVVLEFTSPLPREFTLVLTARAFGRKGEQDATISIGKLKQHVELKNDVREIRLPITLDSDSVRVIKIEPNDPVSPKDLGQSGDDRKIGIGFIGLKLQI